MRRNETVFSISPLRLLRLPIPVKWIHIQEDGDGENNLDLLKNKTNGNNKNQKIRPAFTFRPVAVRTRREQTKGGKKKRRRRKRNVHGVKSKKI